MLQEFRKFALRGNVIDLAVGIILGAAFNSIVQSLVNDIIMPPIGLAVGRLSFLNLMLILKDGTTPGPYATPAAAQAVKAVTINYGVFINNIVSFVITAFAVFLLVRAINRLYAPKEAPKKAEQPATHDCPYCKQTIPLAATRCPYCTSQLEAGPQPGSQPGPQAA